MSTRPAVVAPTSASERNEDERPKLGGELVRWKVKLSTPLFARWELSEASRL